MTSWGCFYVNHIRYIYCISIVDLFWRKKKVSLNSFFSNFQQGFLAPFCPYYTISAAKKSGTVQLLCHTVQSSQNTDIAMHCFNFSTFASIFKFLRTSQSLMSAIFKLWLDIQAMQIHWVDWSIQHIVLSYLINIGFPENFRHFLLNG